MRVYAYIRVYAYMPVYAYMRIATISFFIHRPFRLSLSFVLDDFPFSFLLCGPQAFPNIFPTFGAILRLSLSAIVSRGPYKTPCDA